MNRKIAALLVALSIVAGVGLGYLMTRWNDGPADADTTNPPSPSSSTGSTPPPSDTTGDSAAVELKIRPGGVGLIEAGMTGEQALSTGQIERDTEREEMCEGIYYRWTDEEARSALDVGVTEKGDIASVGISRGTYDTTTGVRVGDRFDVLKEAYGFQLSEPETAGYDQTGVFVNDGDKWLGFLFDAQPDQVNEASRIVFMEVTKGHKPGLMRDGC